MPAATLSKLLVLLSRREHWPDAFEALRGFLKVSAIAFASPWGGQASPPSSRPTLWKRELKWENTVLGELLTDPSPDEAAWALVETVLCSTLAHHRERDANNERFLELHQLASRALDLSELVTWLLHARDDREVERLGTSAVTTMLGVDEGALLTREASGWVLKVPSRELSWGVGDLESTPHGRLLARELVEVESTLDPNTSAIDRQLCAWGYTHSFAVPLDSGAEPIGVLFALSTRPRMIEAEARVAATQLAIMISVALDRLGQQRRLNEQRKALEDAMRLASMGTWELDLHTLEVIWSRELHRLYGGGFSEVKLTIDQAMRIYGPDERFLQERHLRELLGTGTTTSWQLRASTLDGRQIWTRTLCELVRDLDEVPIAIRGVTRDVTVEVDAKLELERALGRATRYEQLFSMSDTLAAVCDADGKIEEASPSWTRQLGYEPHELIGTSVVDLLHRDDLREIRKVLEQRISQGQAAGAVSRLRSRSGHWRWLSWTAALDGGRLYAAATDVTSLQETARRLHVSEEQLRQAGALARIGAWSFDIGSGVLTWSEEVRRMYEVPHDYEPSLGDFFDRFYPPAASATLKAELERSIVDHASYDLELEVITWTGKRIWARHQANVETVEGRATRLFGAFQDVTEQRRAREAALAASRVKSQFLANTSHEIRTPLNGILGMTQLALETSLNSEQREYLDAVRISGENLLNIVNDILDISKIESGRLELEQIPFSLQQAVFEAVRNQANRAHSRNIELVVTFAPGLPDQFIGDGIRVGQIVTNLVGNAVKFTERGEVCVAVSHADDALKLEVRDTGIGIPADRIHSIFEAFTQADGSTNRRFGGTGLGLTITLELVKAMGGTIEVESQPGQGSSFSATLRLAPVAGQAQLTPLVRDTKVMVVGDNRSSRQATAGQLRQLGYQVHEATGTLAVSALMNDPTCRLMVLDQELSQSTGTELAEALEQEAGLRLIPRLLLTRTNTRPTTAELDAAGIKRVLTRPVALTELKHALDQLESGSARVPTLRPTTRTNRRALRVLLAEDNAINARLAQRLVERLGHTVVHVPDGSLAVAAVDREAWDVVLMDMQMPVLDGLEATRRIRRAESLTGRHLPIIALTANAMKGDDQTCLAAGMDAYLTKPIDLDKLGALLDELANAASPGLSA